MATFSNLRANTVERCSFLVILVMSSKCVLQQFFISLLKFKLLYYFSDPFNWGTQLSRYNYHLYYSSYDICLYFVWISIQEAVNGALKLNGCPKKKKKKFAHFGVLCGCAQWNMFDNHRV